MYHLIGDNFQSNKWYYGSADVVWESSPLNNYYFSLALHLLTVNILLQCNSVTEAKDFYSFPITEF